MCVYIYVYIILIINNISLYRTGYFGAESLWFL